MVKNNRDCLAAWCLCKPYMVMKGIGSLAPCRRLWRIMVSVCTPTVVISLNFHSPMNKSFLQMHSSIHVHLFCKTRNRLINGNLHKCGYLQMLKGLSIGQRCRLVTSNLRGTPDTYSVPSVVGNLDDPDLLIQNSKPNIKLERERERVLVLVPPSLQVMFLT